MYQPTTSDIVRESAQPERETVIKFVISGPFLNAEAAHTQWAAEPAATNEMNDLLRRLAELERKLEAERGRVEELCRQLAEVPAPAPVAATLAAPLPAPLGAPIALPLERPEPVAPEPLSIAPAMAEPAVTDAAPAPPGVSTVARTPPPKVRGLRRMIGALRHL
jgi:hypothetical protein